jgi:hypothetical protein
VSKAEPACRGRSVFFRSRDPAVSGGLGLPAPADDSGQELSALEGVTDMRRRSAEVLALCLFGTLCWSCGGRAKISFTPKTPGSYQARQEPCDIEVFQDSKPDRSYVELGALNYHHERHRASAGQLTLDVALPQIKKRACEIGADAIVNVHVTEERRLEWALFHVAATAVRFERK